MQNPLKGGVLNWVDLIIAVVFLGFAIRGLMRGFLRELLSLVGLFHWGSGCKTDSH